MRLCLNILPILGKVNALVFATIEDYVRYFEQRSAKDGRRFADDLKLLEAPVTWKP